VVLVDLTDRYSFKQIALYTNLVLQALFSYLLYMMIIMVAAVIYEVIFKKVSLTLSTLYFGRFSGVFNFEISFSTQSASSFCRKPSTVLPG
jgi:flagellar biosynthesis protein FlhB